MKGWLKDKIAWLKTFNHPPVVKFTGESILDGTLEVSGRVSYVNDGTITLLPGGSITTTNGALIESMNNEKKSEN